MTGVLWGSRVQNPGPAKSNVKRGIFAPDSFAALDVSCLPEGMHLPVPPEKTKAFPIKEKMKSWKSCVGACRFLLNGLAGQTSRTSSQAPPAAWAGFAQSHIQLRPSSFLFHLVSSVSVCFYPSAWARQGQPLHINGQCDGLSISSNGWNGRDGRTAAADGWNSCNRMQEDL